MSALLLLRAVTAAGLLAVADALGVQGAADDLVAHTREVAHPATAHQHDGVLLKVVAHARDVRGDLDLAREPDPGHLAQRRVRLLGGGRVDARADPAALRAGLERRGLVLGYLVLPPLADQLLDRWQRVSVFCAAARVLSGAPGGADVLRCTYLACGFPRPSDPRSRACRRQRGATRPVTEPGRRERESPPHGWPRDLRPYGRQDHSPQSCRARERRTRTARLPTLGARVKASCDPCSSCNHCPPRFIPPASGPGWISAGGARLTPDGA